MHRKHACFGRSLQDGPRQDEVRMVRNCLFIYFVIVLARRPVFVAAACVAAGSVVFPAYIQISGLSSKSVTFLCYAARMQSIKMSAEKEFALLFYSVHLPAPNFFTFFLLFSSLSFLTSHHLL